jgi:hypothetical protein
MSPKSLPRKVSTWAWICGPTPRSWQARLTRPWGKQNFQGSRKFGSVISALELLNLFTESLAFFCDSLPLCGGVVL